MLIKFSVTFKGIINSSILMGALFVFLSSSIGQTVSPSKNKKPVKKEATDDDSIKVRLYDLNHARIAAISSAIIPGLGQAYNKKYWKIPIIYGTGSIIYYFYERNYYYYERCSEALETLEDEQIKDEDLEVMIGTLKDNKVIYRHNYELMKIFMGLLYTANVVDALVDSYMAEYDISKDLSLKISPTILQPTPEVYSASLGVKIGLRF